MSNTNSACSNDWKPQTLVGLYWTKIKPTKPGYYWCSLIPGSGDETVVRVERRIWDDGEEHVIVSEFDFPDCDIEDYTEDVLWYEVIVPCKVYY